MNGKELAKSLREGKRVYGTCLTSASPHRMGVAAALGLDYVFIDTEHTPIDRTLLAWMCQVYRAQEIAPIVRIPTHDPFYATAILDSGASGIIAPYVETVEQVQQLRGAVKLRPIKGKRLEGYLAGTETLEPELLDYITKRNANNVLIINVESKPALDNLDRILDVPGLDAILIGPHDLSCSLAVPEQYGHPKFNEAVRVIIKKARAKNIGVGLHYSEDTEREVGWAKQGANFIVHSSDGATTKRALLAELKILRDAIGDGVATDS